MNLKLYEYRAGRYIKKWNRGDEDFKQNTCDVCGKECPCVVCSSRFGATSFAYCEDCFDFGKEPYNAIVSYISAAGHWPEDINEGYQKEVRRQLMWHEVPEEVFKFDVERAIAEELAFIKTNKGDFNAVQLPKPDEF